MKLVDNHMQYWEFIRELRNLPETRKYFGEERIISLIEHFDYMKTNSNFFKICLIKNKPVGYIRVLNKDVSIAVLPEYRGRGVGVFMLNQVTRAGDVAEIRPGNPASIKVFKKAGFKLKRLIYTK